MNNSSSLFLSDGLFYGIDSDVAKAYAMRLIEHIGYVHEAGNLLGVPKEQLEAHDLSKWEQVEFVGYATHFPNRTNPKDFAVSWLHHIHHNPHHWEHWLFPDHYTLKGSDTESGAMEMPECFALEMVADWMGASKAYTNSWDMTEWLITNIPRIRVHSKTADYLYSVLRGLSYESMWAVKFNTVPKGK